MRDCLELLNGLLTLPFKPKARLEAENLIRRQKLNSPRRSAPKRPRLTNLDRLVCVRRYRPFPNV
jgi:hypothetical protein